jgi:hypothetical protein
MFNQSFCTQTTKSKKFDVIRRKVPKIIFIPVRPCDAYYDKGYYSQVLSDYSSIKDHADGRIQFYPPVKGYIGQEGADDIIQSYLDVIKSSHSDTVKEEKVEACDDDEELEGGSDDLSPDVTMTKKKSDDPIVDIIDKSQEDITDDQETTVRK